MRPRRDSSERNEVSASDALQRLFSEAPLPGLADPAAVEMGGFSVGYRPFERLPISQWADEHRYLTGVGASEPGPWRTSRTPYLREILDNMSTGSPVWKQAFVAGAQIGKTEAGNCCIGYWIAAAPGPIMMVLPKAGTAEKMSKQRITPMINASPTIAEKVTANLLLSKEFHGGVLFFASAQSATDLRAIPVRYLYCDEVDAYPVDCEGEGPPLNLAIARTRTFKNKRKIFLTSTPKEEATSAIWAAWLEGDMRLYHVPCPLCQAMITLEFEGLKWTWGDHKSVRYECPECKGRFGEEHKTWMLERGEWRPTRKDLEDVPEGVRSYRLPSLYAPLGWYGWDEMVAKFEGIYNIPSKLAEFRNVDLGLPSVEVTERIDWETLMARSDVGHPYDLGTVPPGVLFLTAGADVGKDHIEVGVWGWGRDRKRWLIDHFRIEGNTQLPQVWEEAADAVHRVYRNADGVEFGILKFFIDTSAWPEVVKPWVRQQNQQIVMGCDGLDHLDLPVRVEVQAEPVRGAPEKKTRVGALRIAQVGVSLLKAELMGVLSIPRPEASDEAPASWLHLPKQGFTKEMAKQLVSERKVIERDANGRVTGTRWERIEGRRAEVLDCHNYARSSASLVGWDRFRDRDFERYEAKIAAAAAELREAQAAEARGAPQSVEPKAQVGVTPRKPSAPASRKALSQPAPKASTFGVTTQNASRRVVPAPKALRDE